MQGPKNTVKLMVSATLVGGNAKNTVKLLGFALPPDQCCSNATKANAFLMQGPKNTVRLMVSATLVDKQRTRQLTALAGRPAGWLTACLPA